MYVTPLDANNCLTLPSAVRNRLGIKVGDWMKIEPQPETIILALADQAHSTTNNDSYTRVTSRGRIYIPASIRREFGLSPNKLLQIKCTESFMFLYPLPDIIYADVKVRRYGNIVIPRKMFEWLEIPEVVYAKHTERSIIAITPREQSITSSDSKTYSISINTKTRKMHLPNSLLRLLHIDKYKYITIRAIR